jgi:hypothetical protein
MQSALVARQSYRVALRDCPPGPLQERFYDMSARVDDVVEGLYKLVVRAQSLRQYLGRTSATLKETELTRVQSTLRSLGPGVAHDQVAAQTEALEQQLAARRRIEAAYQNAMAKIDATTARIDQMAAQLAEVVLLGDDAAMAGLPGTVDDVNELVEELDSVRLALDEVGASPALASEARPPRDAQPQTE